MKREAGGRTKDGGWEWQKRAEEVVKKLDGERIKEERVDINYYIPLSVSFNCFFLCRISQRIHAFSPFISLCITSVLVPSVHSSVSLLIPFSFNITFFPHHTPFLPTYFYISPCLISSNCLFFSINAFFVLPTKKSYDDSGLISHTNA